MRNFHALLDAFFWEPNSDTNVICVCVCYLLLASVFVVLRNFGFGVSFWGLWVSFGRFSLTLGDYCCTFRESWEEVG